MRGRKPKPTPLKIVEGQRIRKPRGKAPQPDPTLPDCPSHLDKLAQKQWSKYAGELNRLGLLTFIDAPWFAQLCFNLSLSVKAEEKIQEMGAVIEIYEEGEDSNLYIKEIRRNPWVMVEKQASERILKIMSEAGMTPVSRTRASIAKKPKDKPNPLQAWLAQKGKAAVIRGGKK